MTSRAALAMSRPIESSSRLLEHFQTLEDPRAVYLLDRQLLDIIGLTICAVTCGADTWVDIEQYGKVKESWLTDILHLRQEVHRKERSKESRVSWRSSNRCMCR